MLTFDSHFATCKLFFRFKINLTFISDTVPVQLNAMSVMYNTVKPQTTEIKMVTKAGIYRQTTAQCSILALQNAPIGEFCNARMLHLALKCGENTQNHTFKFLFSEVSLY